MERLRWFLGQIHGTFYCILILAVIVAGLAFLFCAIAAIDNLNDYAKAPKIATSIGLNRDFDAYIKSNVVAPPNFKVFLHGKVRCEPRDRGNFCRYEYYPEMIPKWWFNHPKGRQIKKMVFFKLGSSGNEESVIPFSREPADIISEGLKVLAEECAKNRDFVPDIGVEVFGLRF